MTFRSTAACCHDSRHPTIHKSRSTLATPRRPARLCAMPADADTRLMRLALAEARRGLGFTSPNPAVGAVIAKNGRAIGKGYHHRAGLPHAEIEALASIRPERARGATIYV